MTSKRKAPTVEEAQAVLKAQQEKKMHAFLAAIQAVCDEHGMELQPVAHMQVMRRTPQNGGGP
jgi:hypothetical protein